MTIIEKIARAIYDARLAHDGMYRGNVDVPYEDLMASERAKLEHDAGSALLYMDLYRPEAMVAEFHDAFDIPAPSVLSEIETDREKMRLRIDLEEFLELVDACGMELFAHGHQVTLENCAFISNGKTPDPVEIADALGDGIYVKYGHAIERGIPLDDCLREIHRSNMSKLGDDGKPVLRNDGKILKGPRYSPPDIAKVIYGA